MLTAAERNSLLLSVGFLLLGAGIKVWKKWKVEIGPFNPAASSAAVLDKAQTGVASSATPEDRAQADPTSENFTRGDSGHADSSTAAGGDSTALAAAPADPFSQATNDPAETRKPARRGKAKAPKSAPACPVHLNTAPEDRLANLPGVGPRTAAALAAYRKAHGPFRDIRELLAVKGIGEKKLALIAPCLILSGADVKTLPAQASVDPERDGEERPVGP